MARRKTPRKLRYSAYRPVKLRKETDQQLVAIAKKKGMVTSRLMRQIIERWIWGYMNGPGGKSLANLESEKLL
jgi:hypothetical protein